MCLHGNTAIRQYSNTAIRQYGNTAIRAIYHAPSINSLFVCPACALGTGNTDEAILMRVRWVGNTDDLLLLLSGNTHDLLLLLSLLLLSLLLRSLLLLLCLCVGVHT